MNSCGTRRVGFNENWNKVGKGNRQQTTSNIQYLMTLIKQIHAAHDPKLAGVHGHVYQIWQDGEITLQKCGELLWQRNLHRMEQPCYNGLRADQMPARIGSNGYAFVTREDAYRLRDLMIQDAKGEVEEPDPIGEAEAREIYGDAQ